jgi:DNA-binding transcriptional ArsR family regulator
MTAPLATALAAIASPVRLDLLRRLRQPRVLSDIVVASPDDGRPLARQTVKFHLDPLVEAGVVVAREVERQGRRTTLYVVNHQMLYAYAEEFRELAAIRPEVEPGVPTVRAPAEAVPPAPPPGPALVLVKGIDEGRRFGLTPGPGRAEWLVGRRRDADVPLDFDPFVSSEHAVVAWRDGRYWLRDVGGRNGTLLNFREVAGDGDVPLRHGDVLSVGRSVLVLRE